MRFFLFSRSSPDRAELMRRRDRFYDGAKMEKDILNRAYLRLIKHVNSIFKVRTSLSLYSLSSLAYLDDLDRADPNPLRHGSSSLSLPPLLASTTDRMVGIEQIEDFIVKYMWSACGYCLISIPVFFAPVKEALIGGAATEKDLSLKSEDHSVAHRTESEFVLLAPARRKTLTEHRTQTTSPIVVSSSP